MNRLLVKFQLQKVVLAPQTLTLVSLHRRTASHMTQVYHIRLSMADTVIQAQLSKD